MQLPTSSMSKERHDEIESIIIQTVRAELLRVIHLLWMDQKRAIFDKRFGKSEISEAELLEKKWDIAKIVFKMGIIWVYIPLTLKK